LELLLVLKQLETLVIGILNVTQITVLIHQRLSAQVRLNPVMVRLTVLLDLNYVLAPKLRSCVQTQTLKFAKLAQERRVQPSNKHQHHRLLAAFAQVGFVQLSSKLAQIQLIVKIRSNALLTHQEEQQ
jgi:hypothetical protein